MQKFPSYDLDQVLGQTSLFFRHSSFIDSVRVPVDSDSLHVTFDLVIRALSRCFVLIVGLAILAVGLPTRAEVPQPKPPQQRMSCCKHFPGEPGHCGGSEPLKSQENQCCSACNLCLSLILASTYPFVFAPDRSEKLFSEIAASSSRSDRPPVPPPRV
jgi:hypothetical protein